MFINVNLYERKSIGAGEVAQRLGALAALAEDLSWGPSIRGGWL